MGRTKNERQQRYRGFLAEAVSDKERELIKQAVQRGQLTGGGAFIDEIEAKLQRRIEFRKRGRPKGSGLMKSGDRPEVSPLKAHDKQRKIELFPFNAMPVAATNSHNGSLIPVGSYVYNNKYFNVTKDQLYSGTDEVAFSDGGAREFS